MVRRDYKVVSDHHVFVVRYIFISLRGVILIDVDWLSYIVLIEITDNAKDHRHVVFSDNMIIIRFLV